MTEERPDLDPNEVRSNYFQRRRDKIVEEIQANRRGEYVVPTWVLTLCLVAMIAGIGLLIYLTGD